MLCNIQSEIGDNYSCCVAKEEGEDCEDDDDVDDDWELELTT